MIHAYSSPLFRKVSLLGKRFQKIKHRFDQDRMGTASILANSFPKSGTHLLTQILESFPGITNYSYFITNATSVRFRERSEEEILNRIMRIVPGEMATGHVKYRSKVIELLEKQQCATYFIYRDPRDIVLSEVYYLTYMNSWHRLHAYFARHLKNDEERIKTAILGIQDSDSSLSAMYPNIVERFKPFHGWILDKRVFAVKFEDLITQNRDKLVMQMMLFFAKQTGIQIDVEQSVLHSLDNINPLRSHTFREGRAGRWRDRFSREHVELFKETAGELLIQLGFEDDLNW